MNGTGLLAVFGFLLLISLFGPTMTLFRRPSLAQSAAGATASCPYRYLGPDGQLYELGYDNLPTDLGRWTYATQTSPSFFFAFDLERHGSVVRIYIVEAPRYGSREDGLLVTHRLADGDRRYICIREGNEPVDGREAATWLIYWSEATANYILTGKSFS